MMKHFILFLLSLITTTGCTDESVDLFSGNADWGTEESPVANDAIDSNLFEVINLDYPGLGNVKSYYEEGEYYFASRALLEYYRTRTDVVDPNVSLIGVTSSEDDRLKADYALDYRFFINNYYEDAGAKMPYLFKSADSIDWTMNPLNEDEFQKQLHRHQWLVPQAKVYRVTRDEKYFKSWLEVYSDWIKQNPIPAGGTNTTTWWPLQVSARVESQIALFAYYKNSINFTPQVLNFFLTNFAKHANHMVAHPASDGNMLISQAYSLAYAGIVFPEFKNSDQWLNAGATILGNAAADQFMDDGMHFELDFSYHISAIGDFNQALALANANNKIDKLPNYVGLLKNATEVVKHFIYPSFFGGTVAYPYFVPGFNDTRQTSWTRNVLTRNLNTYVEMFPEDKELLYLASQGREGVCPPTTLKIFPTSGYYMMRNGWDRTSTMMIHSNNRKREPDVSVKRWEHNQPDNGTFELYHNGRNFFPDTGVFSYDGDATAQANRNEYRATRMHNTLTLNNANISYSRGVFLKATTGTTEMVVSQNKGYGSDLTHRRAIFFVDKTFFVIVDEAFGAAAGTTNLNFNLCEGTNAEVVYDLSAHGAHTAFSDGNNMMFRTFGNKEISSSSFTGKVSYTIGGTADRKSYSVNMAKTAGETARYITVLYPINSTMPTIGGEFVGDYSSAGASVKVTIDGTTYPLSYTLD